MVDIQTGMVMLHWSLHQDETAKWCGWRLQTYYASHFGSAFSKEDNAHMCKVGGGESALDCGGGIKDLQNKNLLTQSSEKEWKDG